MIQLLKMKTHYFQDMLIPDEMYQDMMARGYNEQVLDNDPGPQVIIVSMAGFKSFFICFEKVKINIIPNNKFLPHF